MRVSGSAYVSTMTDEDSPTQTNKSLGPTPQGGHKSPDNRCRLVLVLTGERLQEFGAAAPDILGNALVGGDVASVILAQNTLDETPFLELAKPCIAIIQNAGSAAMIAGDPRVAGRLGADGIQYGQDIDGLRDGMDRYAPKFMVAAGNIRSRHNALIIGEAQPDYVMFGKPGGDTQALPHPRNLELAAWWSAMIEIPCIAMGGTAVGSVADVAKAGAEFVGLGAAIFGPKDGPIPSLTDDDTPETRVREANEALNTHAPTLLEADEV